MHSLAAFGGVAAMKGSPGHVPAWPWGATGMLSHAGPMPLSARDSALLFNITKGPDPLDHQALPDDQADHTDTHPIQSLRIGLAPSLFGFPVAPEIDCGVRRVITAPRGSANMFVTDRRPPENIVEAVRAEELEIICA